MQMETQDCRKQALFTRLSRVGYLGLGLAVFAMIVMLFQSPSSQVFATQVDNEQSDAKRGQDVFAKRCSGCHSLDNDKEGPRLRRIYGKKAATLSTTFNYSEALKNSNVTWDAPSLDQWMADAEKIVPNSDMFFRLPRANERADVVAFLKSLSDQTVKTAASLAAPAPPAGEVEVKIDNFAFVPATITIPAGTSIRWLNEDETIHNVVSSDKSFRSKALDTNEEFSFTFTKPGTYSYICSLHPRMTGKVIVE